MSKSAQLKSALKQFNSYCVKRDCFPAINMDDKNLIVWVDIAGYEQYAMDKTTGVLYSSCLSYGGHYWKPNYFQYI